MTMRRTGPYALLTALAILGAALLSFSVMAQVERSQTATPKTVLDGVFTPAQAERGREPYEFHCSSCHRKDLQGMDGPPLIGQVFIDGWREDGLSSLFTYIQTKMPPRAAATLPDDTYLDILAYILAENTFPAGSTDLTANTLRAIRLVGKQGPAEIPKFALIEIVGCLAQGGGEWTLTNASSPVRTRQPRATATTLQASTARALGNGTFRLVYLDSLRPAFVPEEHRGDKIHATGYLLKNDKGDGLSVTWLESIGRACNG
jgi:mono/diheme cytochrome c family protein